MEDKLAQYGVFLGKRYNTKQKEKFLNVIAQEFKEMGYHIQAARANDKSKSSAMNLFVGDVTKAQTIYGAYYDTPAKNLWPVNVKYYPLNGTKSHNSMMVPTFLPVLLTLGIAIALIAYLFANKAIGGSYHLPVVIVAAFLVLLVTSAISRGFANKVNLNRNTASILALLEVAKKLPTDKRSKVAFVIYDHGVSDNEGLKMMQIALPKTLAVHQFILLDCIGSGTNYQIGYKENNEKEARLLQGGYSGEKPLDIIKMDESMVIYTGSFFLPKCIVVSCGNIESDELVVNNTGTSKDNDVNVQNISEISDLLIKYVK